MAKMIKRAKSLIPSEDQEQEKLVTYLGKKGIRFYAIPNGGYRHYLEAAKFKRCGVSPGVPDICIPKPIGPYHGLYIELKRIKGGRPSFQQIDWLTYLRNAGYWADIAKGADEAIEMVEHYLSLDYNIGVR